MGADPANSTLPHWLDPPVASYSSPTLPRECEASWCEASAAWGKRLLRQMRRFLFGASSAALTGIEERSPEV
jgi:hypothetical protein